MLSYYHPCTETKAQTTSMTYCAGLVLVDYSGFSSFTAYHVENEVYKYLFIGNLIMSEHIEHLYKRLSISSWIARYKVRK